MGRIAAEFLHRGPHAPILRRMAFGTVTKPLVQPLCIFGAARAAFDVIVRKRALAPAVLIIIFDMLPMRECGWDFATTLIHFAGNSSDNWPIWRLCRG